MIGLMPSCPPVGPRAISFLGSAANAQNSSSVSITVPSTVKAGDILVLWIRSINSSGIPTTQAISGWAVVGDYGASTRRGTLYTKIASASDASSTITATAGSSTNHIILLAFRTDVPVTSLTTTLCGGELTDFAPANQTAAASGKTRPLAIVAAYATSANVSNRGFTPAKDGEVSSNGSGSAGSWLAYKVYSSAPANHTINTNDDGNGNELVSVILEAA